MELQRKLLENSAYRMFTEMLLAYMLDKAGLALPDGVALGECCLCDDMEWTRNVTADKDPRLVSATLKPGRFNMGHIFVNTRRLSRRETFSIFCMSTHQLAQLSIDTIHELAHFWYAEHCDQFYEVMTKTGVIVDYTIPRNNEGYLHETGVEDELIENAAEFLVHTYNEIELSGMCRFIALNNPLFRV